jgi:tRNA (mo5U34)-methyltransferase
MISQKSISEKVASVPHWYHQIPMPDGTLTPGINDSAGTLKIYDSLGFPRDFTGKRVLDIGCADGYLSFIAEKRGALEVIAVDYRLPTASGFSVAAEILGSKVKHVVDNVYELSPEKYGLFDFVIFAGVLYHLRNPLLALDKVRAMVKVGGGVIVESHICDAELEENMHKIGLNTLQIEELSELAIWSFYYANTLNNDASNKWAPTLSGLCHVCKEAQLMPASFKRFGSRGATLCDAVEDASLEHFRKMDTFVGLNKA